MTLTLNFSGGSRGTVGTLVTNPIIASLEGLLSLFSTLFKAHLGYLHLVRAFLRCSFSFLSSSGLLHTVLGPIGECVNDTKFSREVMVAIPL